MKRKNLYSILVTFSLAAFGTTRTNQPTAVSTGNLPDSITVNSLGGITPKGKTLPVEIYSVGVAF